MDLVEIALGEVGVKEDAGRRNRGERVDEYIRAGGLDPEAGEWAWCCAFVCWSLKQAGVQTPTTCSVSRFLQLALEQGWTKRQESAVGNMAIHLGPKGNHCGIVTGDDGSTTEGNTNAEGSREGDCVNTHLRPAGYWTCYLRPKQ